MCYDTAQLAYRIYRDAIRLKASPAEIGELKEKWERLKEGEIDFYHTSGFSHQKLAAFIQKDDRIDINRFHWGLIPAWTKDEEQARQIWNKTINAMGETIFEKPSFRDAARMGRCVIPLDGFYEYYHKGGKSFPYFIRRQDKKRLFIGGLSTSWLNKETGEIIDTMSIVTTKANEFLSRIHNNPKLKEARMPLILDDEDAVCWLEGDQHEAMEVIKSNKTQKLEAWTVRKLKGKEYIGNDKKNQEKFEYKELVEPPELF